MLFFFFFPAALLAFPFVEQATGTRELTACPSKGLQSLALSGLMRESEQVLQVTWLF